MTTAEPGDLRAVRASIDALDERLVALLLERQALVERAVSFKRDDADVRAPDRVADVVRLAQQRAATAGGSPEVVGRVYTAMIAAFVDHERAHRLGSASEHPGVRWSAVTIDCLDVARVSSFWSALLDRPPGPSEEGWVYLGERDDTLPRLVFQPVPEPKSGKARLHLDVRVDDIDARVARVARVVELGGRRRGSGTCTTPAR